MAGRVTPAFDSIPPASSAQRYHLQHCRQPHKTFCRQGGDITNDSFLHKRLSYDPIAAGDGKRNRPPSHSRNVRPVQARTGINYLPVQQTTPVSFQILISNSPPFGLPIHQRGTFPAVAPTINPIEHTAVYARHSRECKNAHGLPKSGYGSRFVGGLVGEKQDPDRELLIAQFVRGA